METIINFFSNDGLAPHGLCLTWRPDVFWTLAVADGLTGLSYLSIPFAIFYFVRRRPGHRFSKYAVLFSAFIGLCGLTHLLDIWTLWVPDYGVLALAKTATATTSIVTAVSLWVLMPRALILPTHRELELKNQALRDSEDRFRSLVESTTDWVWETDADHCFTWFSSSLESMLGISSSVLLGKRRWDTASATLDGDSGVWRSYREDLDAHRNIRNFRYWITTDNGDRKWIAINGAPRFDRNGAFLGYRGVGSDVTSEAESAMQLKLLSTVVEQSPMSVVVTNPDGVIEYVNPYFTTVSGYTAADVIGKNPRVVASSLTPDEVYQDLWATITAGGRWSGELRNQRKNGQLIWETVAIAPLLNEDGRIVHYVAVKQDVTERRDLQDKLRQTNAELEQFAYVASHDLRQPLRMVNSYLNLIEQRLAGRLDDELQEFLGYAVGGAKRMDRLILDLLEYSRTGRSGQPESTSLAEAVADAEANLTVAIRDSGAEIRVVGELPAIIGNPVEITRLFQNLIGNAVKYQAPERRPKVEIDCRRNGPEWLIAVKDNGIGIAPENCERAFGVFQRLVSQQEYEGTGIGLAVCRKIVEHHGGRIWIDSRLGEGSTFFVTLPVAV